MRAANEGDGRSTPPEAPGNQPGNHSLEARRLCRYLLATEATEEVVSRYRRACAIHFAQPAEPEDQHLLSFAVEHPALIPILDAALGLWEPQALLRRKILLLASICETSPRYAEEFLPRPSGYLRFGWKMGTLGIVSLFKALIGFFVLKAVRRRAR